MRGYPISSFLFWELKPENRDRWKVYEFLENAAYGGMHNQLASTVGVPSLTLVLDGQQRLTSLMIGLRGRYSVKRKHKRWTSPDAISTQKLYLDLLADPRLESDEDETPIYYKFEFKERQPVPDNEHYWFHVGKILDFDEQSKFDDFLDEKDKELTSTGLTKSERRVFEKNLERLYKSIHEDEVIAYYTETDQGYDRVFDIFVRANEGGTKLSKSDLLLSIVTASWDGVNAREEIFNFVDRLNTGLTRRNDFDKDFIMRSCLVLSDFPVAYKVQNFNNANLSIIRKSWAAIKKAVEQGVDLANSFGIDRDNLTSANALIPIIYYLFKNPGLSLRGSTPFEARNADRIRRWLIMALLNGVFGSTSDNMLRDIRACLQETTDQDKDFPLESINNTIKRSGRQVGFDEEDILSRNYRQQQTFLILSLLYDELSWGTMQFHQDHIFARNLFKPKELALSGRPYWEDEKEQIGNLCLLLAHENMGKQDMPLDEWLRTRVSGFLKRHLIPDNESLWKFDRFQQFMKARQELISKRLQSVLGS